MSVAMPHHLAPIEPGTVATSSSISASGTVKISPYSLLNLMAISRSDFQMLFLVFADGHEIALE